MFLCSHAQRTTTPHVHFDTMVVNEIGTNHFFIKKISSADIEKVQMLYLFLKINVEIFLHATVFFCIYSNSHTFIVLPISNRTQASKFEMIEYVSNYSTYTNRSLNECVWADFKSQKKLRSFVRVKLINCNGIERN